MTQCKGWLIIIILSASWCGKAQDADSLSLETDSLFTRTDSLLTYNDSLNIFQLIDSLLLLEKTEIGSQLAVRLAYNSNVLSAGRTLGIDQFGLMPGLSYYHKTGFYGDLSLYWSNNFEPEYYLTILTAGYMHTFSRHFSIIANYDRYFYRFEEDFTPYKNAFMFSPFLDFKPFSFRCDYSYFFGDQDAHRIMPSISGILEKKGLFGIDKISFTPGIFMLLGNETLTEIIFPVTLAEWREAIILYSQGLPWYTVKTQNVFGVMNYAFTAPLNINHKNWNFSFSYTYNIPKALPGEPLQLSESGYLSAGLTYFISFRRPKRIL
jgi:hypothetical protein